MASPSGPSSARSWRRPSRWPPRPLRRRQRGPVGGAWRTWCCSTGRSGASSWRAWPGACGSCRSCTRCSSSPSVRRPRVPADRWPPATSTAGTSTGSHPRLTSSAGALRRSRRCTASPRFTRCCISAWMSSTWTWTPTCSGIRRPGSWSRPPPAGEGAARSRRRPAKATTPAPWRPSSRGMPMRTASTSGFSTCGPRSGRRSGCRSTWLGTTTIPSRLINAASTSFSDCGPSNSASPTSPTTW
mmetsp:Transcript_80528/g.226496  ORF Transcript_80528/g.226496 Transcript_80528/m.226496 type:complete len:243 (+) Transcript_80528:1219-1947(+)